MTERGAAVVAFAAFGVASQAVIRGPVGPRPCLTYNVMRHIVDP